jgi:hypothetical protein
MSHGVQFQVFAAAALLLQACAAQAPSAPPARVFAADMTGAAKACTVPPVTPAAGQLVDVAMKVGNDGGWCAITVNNNGRPFDAGLVATPPAHGKVLIHTVGNDTRIDYTPAARYAGADAFSLRLIPGDATIRAAVTVTP